MKKIKAELTVLAPELKLQGSHAEVSMLVDKFLDGLSVYVTPSFIRLQSGQGLKHAFRAWLVEANTSGLESADEIIPRFISVTEKPVETKPAVVAAGNVVQLFG